ncbi:hypothetical protein [Embleya sp. MST-111070]|uniref:hypothetical protein n=1 Tax=Embleya sp. MST-111070 TaxID=3398231 RepID=UPI003F73CFA3
MHIDDHVPVHELMSISASQRYRLLADRLHATRLWAHEDVFATVFADAARLVFGGGEQHRDARRFVDQTFVNLITRPGDLVLLCRAVADVELRLAVVEAYVRHPLVSENILSAMGASGEVHRELPPGGWTEVPMYHHAIARLRAEPDRRFDLHELTPFGTRHDLSAAASALRAALEADQLTDQARALVLESAIVDIPEPAYHEGDRVRVVVDDRNRTPHSGSIRYKLWHYRDRTWYFLLRTDTGARISKRYAAGDLRPD